MFERGLLAGLVPEKPAFFIGAGDEKAKAEYSRAQQTVYGYYVEGGDMAHNFNINCVHSCVLISSWECRPGIEKDLTDVL